jgi:predicted nucleotidyltransferase
MQFDATLRDIVQELTRKYRCHTVILYGSRAIGQTTPTSDYDVIGVRKDGKKTRIAKKQDGKFWDVLVYPEKDLRKLDDQHLSWKHARILHSVGPYGKTLLTRIKKLLKKPFKPHPDYEIESLRTWAQKQLERCRMTDIQGLYRRAEFQNALIDHYFFIRQKRFWGPKEGFVWLKENDPKAFNLIHRTLRQPTNISYLKAAAEAVYQVRLK